MKLSVSNIALPEYRHAPELAELRESGIEGIEVAPSRIWRNTWKKLTPADIDDYRRQIEQAGLSTVGLHSLLYDQPGLSLCESPEQRDRLLEFFVHLSSVCRDLGGHTLIWGGGRRRGDVPVDAARDIAVEFFSKLADRTAGHGTCFCLEPLGPKDTDFIHSVYESIDIVEAVGSASLRVQIDAKALLANDEFESGTFRAAAAFLVHYHANEPDLGILGSSALIDHAAAGTYLRDIGYDGFVSLEQKMIGTDDPMAAVRQSVAAMKEAYA